MKQPKNVDDLAARLTTAATAPLQTLAPASSPAVAPVAAAPAVAPTVPATVKTWPAAKKARAETLGINLRPSRTLYERYVALAADRSKETGRVVSAQQIMLEVLERRQA